MMGSLAGSEQFQKQCLWFVGGFEFYRINVHDNWRVFSDQPCSICESNVSWRCVELEYSNRLGTGFASSLLLKNVDVIRRSYLLRPVIPSTSTKISSISTWSKETGSKTDKTEDIGEEEVTSKLMLWPSFSRVWILGNYLQAVSTYVRFYCYQWLGTLPRRNRFRISPCRSAALSTESKSIQETVLKQ